MNYKPLFSRALGLDPERLHFAAHSHHLWPDVSFDGQVQAWAEANRFADRKWDLVFGEVIPEAQAHVAKELGLPSPDSLIFAPNTHEILLRIVSAVDKAPVRIKTFSPAPCRSTLIDCTLRRTAIICGPTPASTVRFAPGSKPISLRTASGIWCSAMWCRRRRNMWRPN